VGNKTEIMPHVLKLQYISFSPKIHRMNFRVGHAAVHLVEILRYKPEGHRFDSHWCHWNFSLTHSFQPPYDPGVD